MSPLLGSAIVIRLSGHAQTTDKSAVREMLRQISVQTGSILAAPDDGNEQERGAEVEDGADADIPLGDAFQIPPPNHILSAVSSLTSVSRPVIVIVDALDLFAAHPRQALLYCLFDAVQSCRSSKGLHGLAVAGVTSRVDCINLLEKRVKSRFSHRIVRTSMPGTFEQFVGLVRSHLSVPLTEDTQQTAEWNIAWITRVDVCCRLSSLRKFCLTSRLQAFLEVEIVREALRNTFAISGDLLLMNKLLVRLASVTTSCRFHIHG